MRIFFAILVVSLASLVWANRPNNKRLFNDRIKVIQLKKCKGIIFPATYAKDLFSHSNNTGYFTPDEKTIRYIDQNLAGSLLILTTPVQKQNPKFKISQESLETYDKQFVGYVNVSHDSIILGQMFNFESDPYKTRDKIQTEFINPGRVA